MKRHYYSLSVRLGLQSIASRVVPQTADEIDAINYIHERQRDHVAKMRRLAQGRAEGRARVVPVAPQARADVPGKPGASDSTGGNDDT